MSTETLIWYLVVLLIAVAVNGLFVAFEFALVAMRRSRVQELIEQGVVSARIVRRLQNDMDESISGAQVGITVASLVLGRIGEPAVHELIDKAMVAVPFDVPYVTVQSLDWLPMVLSLVLLSLVHVVLGEQVPKGLALRFPEKLLLLAAGPFLVYRWLSYPLIWAFSMAAKGFLRLLGIRKSANHEPVHSADELSMIIDGSTVSGEIDKVINKVLQQGLDLQDLTVADVMVDLAEVEMLELGTSFHNTICAANDSKHSRLPIYAGERNNIIGVFSTKDLFDVVETTLNRTPLEGKLGTMARDFHLADYRRDIWRVSAGMKASSVLHMFLVRKMPMALVIDDPETRVNIGVITLEDLLERLVGEIQDEFDTDEE
jgi:CBS domain containing-hemolysin-like protein